MCIRDRIMKDSVGANSLRRLSKRVLDQFGDYNHESKLMNMPKNLEAIEDELQLAAVQEQIQAKIAAQAQEKSRAGQEKVKSHLDEALKKFQEDGGAQKLTKNMCHAILLAKFKIFYTSSQLQKKKVAELREELKSKIAEVSAAAPAFQLS